MMGRIYISSSTFVKLAKRTRVHFRRNFSDDKTTFPPLTSCGELHEHMKRNDWFDRIRILDARWNLDDRDYRAMHMENRIFGSKFFSFEECRDMQSPFSRMLPTSAQFSDYVTDLGICNKHHVIIYDDNPKVGAFSSPRVWWMFRAFGHNKVSVLDGGFGKWIADSYPTVSGAHAKEENLPRSSKQPFHSLKNPKFVVNFEAVKDIVLSETTKQLTDARSGKRFAEGHITQAMSVPYAGLFHNDKTMKSKDEVKQYFKEQHLDVNSDIISSCGSGITASIVAHALFYSTGKEVPVYDGSYAEWKVRAPELVSRDQATDDS